MELLHALLLLVSAVAERTRRDPVEAAPSLQIHARLGQDEVTRYVATGGRFAILSRRTGPDGQLVEFSELRRMPGGSGVPDGWTGGEDVTARMLARLRVTPAERARLLSQSVPLTFPNGLDRESTYSAGVAAVGGAIYAVLLVLWIAMVSQWSGGTFFVVLVASVVILGASFAILAWEADLNGFGGPMYRREPALVAIPLVLATAIAALVPR